MNILCMIGIHRYTRVTQSVFLKSDDKVFKIGHFAYCKCGRGRLIRDS